MSQLGRTSSPVGYVFAAAVFALQAGAIDTAHACTLIAPEPYVIDPGLRAVDTTAPAPFTDVSAHVERWSNTLCRGDECTASTCPSSGTVRLSFAMPSDDQAESRGIGYRIVWLRGQMPPAAESWVGPIWPLRAGPRDGEGSLGFDVGFESAPGLDAEVALIAVDRAGNESAQSAPIALKFSGCTLSLDSNICDGATACSVPQIGTGSWTDGSRVAWPLATLLIARVIRRRRSRSV